MGAGPGGSKSGSPLRCQQHPEGIVPVGDKSLAEGGKTQRRRDGGASQRDPQTFPETVGGASGTDRAARVTTMARESRGLCMCKAGGSSVARVRLAGVCGEVFLPKSEKPCCVAVRSQLFASASSSSLIP